ncbi:hypothetical protein ACFY1U_22810 [Streptomyces sp. NPDC001351]|uniref:hypothetical protein n=1 Tax=Streptomyces sp. NPDC001351 TaxID=3364564 RepID=UPI00368367AD
MEEPRTAVKLPGPVEELRTAERRSGLVAMLGAVGVLLGRAVTVSAASVMPDPPGAEGPGT